MTNDLIFSFLFSNHFRFPQVESFFVFVGRSLNTTTWYMWVLCSIYNISNFSFRKLLNLYKRFLLKTFPESSRNCNTAYYFYIQHKFYFKSKDSKNKWKPLPWRKQRLTYSCENPSRIKRDGGKSSKAKSVGHNTLRVSRMMVLLPDRVTRVTQLPRATLGSPSLKSDLV